MSVSSVKSLCAKWEKIAKDDQSPEKEEDEPRKNGEQPKKDQQEKEYNRLKKENERLKEENKKLWKDKQELYRKQDLANLKSISVYDLVIKTDKETLEKFSSLYNDYFLENGNRDVMTFFAFYNKFVKLAIIGGNIPVLNKLLKNFMTQDRNAPHMNIFIRYAAKHATFRTFQYLLTRIPWSYHYENDGLDLCVYEIINLSEQNSETEHAKFVRFLRPFNGGMIDMHSIPTEEWQKIKDLDLDFNDLTDEQREKEDYICYVGISASKEDQTPVFIIKQFESEKDYENYGEYIHPDYLEFYQKDLLWRSMWSTT